MRVKETYVNRDEILLLGGKYQTTVRQLLAMSPGALQMKKTQTFKNIFSKKGFYISVKRDPETGMIIPQRC